MKTKGPLLTLLEAPNKKNILEWKKWKIRKISHFSLCIKILLTNNVHNARI